MNEDLGERARGALERVCSGTGQEPSSARKARPAAVSHRSTAIPP